MKEKEEKIEVCLAYFRMRPVYHKLFNKIKRKICKSGTYGRYGDSLWTYTGGKERTWRIFPEKIIQKIKR